MMAQKQRFQILIATFAALATILTVTSTAWAKPRYKVLHAFGDGQDGAGTWGSLLLDAKGDLYGTTGGGGAYGYGTAFELTHEPDGRWSETILHDFDRNGQDGYGPTSNLVFGGTGNLYGTTTYGGANYDAGTVFELVDGATGWTENVIYNFGGHQNDGFEPYSGVTVGATGYLFGTTPHGGTVFELTDHSSWNETVLHDFIHKPHDGSGPFAGVVLDTSGNLFGTTEYGGEQNLGVVYELSPNADGSWKERILHDFCTKGPPNCPDGHTPGVGALTMDSAENLYGTTDGGGCCGGVVFRLSPQPDGHWKETVLHDFKGGADGYGPGAGVVRDKAGNLYGTTIYGGKGGGVVYKLSPGKNGKWEYTVLHTFTGSDGAQPDANLILDGKGNLYGTTATGGTYGGGVAFELTP
jgi:uncharacterized repeat protein (TIGR03803 family)